MEKGMNFSRPDYQQVSNQEYAERKDKVARFRVNIKGADKYNLIDGQTDEIVKTLSTKWEAVRAMDAANKALLVSNPTSNKE